MPKIIALLSIERDESKVSITTTKNVINDNFLKEIISKYKIKDERLVKPNNNNIFIIPEKIKL
jgi:hypothetical protein